MEFTSSASALPLPKPHANHADHCQIPAISRIPINLGPKPATSQCVIPSVFPCSPSQRVCYTGNLNHYSGHSSRRGAVPSHSKPTNNCSVRTNSITWWLAFSCLPAILVFFGIRTLFTCDIKNDRSRHPFHLFKTYLMLTQFGRRLASKARSLGGFQPIAYMYILFKQLLYLVLVSAIQPINFLSGETVFGTWFLGDCSVNYLHY